MHTYIYISDRYRGFVRARRRITCERANRLLYKTDQMAQLSVLILPVSVDLFISFSRLFFRQSKFELLTINKYQESCWGYTHVLYSLVSSIRKRLKIEFRNRLGLMLANRRKIGNSQTLQYSSNPFFLQLQSQ